MKSVNDLEESGRIDKYPESISTTARKWFSIDYQPTTKTAGSRLERSWRLHLPASLFYVTCSSPTQLPRGFSSSKTFNLTSPLEKQLSTWRISAWGRGSSWQVMNRVPTECREILKPPSFSATLEDRFGGREKFISPFAIRFLVGIIRDFVRNLTNEDA